MDVEKLYRFPLTTINLMFIVCHPSTYLSQHFNLALLLQKLYSTPLEYPYDLLLFMSNITDLRIKVPLSWHQTSIPPTLKRFLLIFIVVESTTPYLNLIHTSVVACEGL